MVPAQSKENHVERGESVPALGRLRKKLEIVLAACAATDQSPRSAATIRVSEVSGNKLETLDDREHGATEDKLRAVYRLLLITSACDREDVGEAWSGFQWVSRLAARHDVTLLTMHRRDRTPPSRQISNARVVEWRDAKLLARQERINSMLKPGWIPFYCGARRWIRDALARGEHFDLAHQLLPLALRYPSPAAGLGIPLS